MGFRDQIQVVKLVWEAPLPTELPHWFPAISLNKEVSSDKHSGETGP